MLKGFAANDNKFDATRPITICPYIEDNEDMMQLYDEDLALFWVTVMSPECTVPFMVVDGAHRWQVTKQLKLSFTFALSARPEISIGEMVRACTTHAHKRAAVCRRILHV